MVGCVAGGRRGVKEVTKKKWCEFGNEICLAWFLLVKKKSNFLNVCGKAKEVDGKEEDYLDDLLVVVSSINLRTVTFVFFL